MRILLALISFLFVNDFKKIHQDTPLKIDKNGNIIGLPKEFNPANFDLKTNRLRIKNKEVIFPKCLSDYFNEFAKPKLNLSASWYHSKETLPYYINFSISDKDAKYGYTILINLETLELIHVNKVIKEGNTTYTPKVDVGQKCLDDYKSAIKTVFS